MAAGAKSSGHGVGALLWGFRWVGVGWGWGGVELSFQWGPGRRGTDHPTVQIASWAGLFQWYAENKSVHALQVSFPKLYAKEKSVNVRGADLCQVTNRQADMMVQALS